MKTQGDAIALAKLIKTYIGLREQLTDIETKLQAVKDRLLEAAIANGGHAETSSHTVKVISMERKTINGSKLIERGVTPAIIEYATTVTPVCYARVDEKR